MKKLLLALFLVLATQTYAQIIELRKEVLCGSNKTIAATLDKYDEKLYWQSRDNDSGNNISLFVNEKTLSWTLTESNREIACILSTGEGFRTKPADLPKSTPKSFL